MDAVDSDQVFVTATSITLTYTPVYVKLIREARGQVIGLLNRTLEDPSASNYEYKPSMQRYTSARLTIETQTERSRARSKAKKPMREKIGHRRGL